MKVLVGGIHQEANTFSGIKMMYHDFRRYHGTELLNCLSQCSLLVEAGYKVIPAVFATTIPSAPLDSTEFDKFVEDFFSSCDDKEVPDAIYLCMHGAMYIKGVGSGELYFLRKLREKYGEQIPVFASFDFHGNMFSELASKLNYVTAYKTAPHVDEAETGERAVRALISSLQSGNIPKVKCITIPMTFPGEMVITEDHPSSDILDCMDAIVRERLAIEACWFCGFIWSDSAENHMSLTVTSCEFSGELEKRVKEAVKKIWSLRSEFHFSTPAMEVEEALHTALEKTGEMKKVFLSDSGDNVTAGTSGDNAYMAGAILDYIESHPGYARRKILVTGIADKEAVNCCINSYPGAELELSIGGKLDPSSTSVEGSFILIQTGTIPESRSNTAMSYALVRKGNMDILLNQERCAYTSYQQFQELGIDLEIYDMICIKLGYLYAELEVAANASYIAFSPGNAPQKPQMIPYTEKRTDFYPLADVEFDVDKQWKGWWNNG